MFRLRLLQRLPLGSQVARKSRQFTDVTECTNEFIDITGYRVSISDPSALALYNESLTNFLTHEKDPSVQLNLIRERNKNVGMVNSLLVFQMIRQPKPHDLTEEEKITEILRSLDENMREGSLSPREEIFAAAAASFVLGNYLNAAALLESNLMSKNDDIIAMKLAQDSYMLAGDGNNALGCIARSMHLFDSSNQLQGHVMGMFAAGLLEVGRYSDAEEMANKAVTKTKGLDIWALHTLCNAYAMLGRSSEIGSAINEHINKHKNSTIGLPLLLFNKGCGLIMRGNSNAAVLAHDNIIFDIIDKKDSQVAGTLANATLLLWVISLNSPSVDIDDRWIHVNSVAGLWSGGIKEAEVEGNKVELKGNDESDDGREGAMRGSMSAMNVVCRAMALSASDRCATAALLKNSNMINNIEEVLSEEDKGIEMERLNKKKGRMSELQLAIYINKKLEVIEIYAEKIWFTIKRYTKPDWHMPAVKIEEVVYNKEETAARVAAAARIMTASAEAKARHHSDSLDILIKLSKDDFGDRLGKKEYLESICPLLLSVKPQVSAAKRIPESPSACSVTDKEWSIRSVAEPLFQAVLSFSQHDYDDSSDKLNECRLSQTLSRLGGTAAQRDIISQTLIESLLRCGRVEEAEILLCERTTFTPTDAQSWRRLASVYGRRGQRDEANRANYTAWQNGIGQGGFGGST